ncbi:MAG: hypothetical protein M3O36_21800, partial [Myxococcota bacterium]|nr:hypothetical protein [Myxococcota bacterium]
MRFSWSVVRVLLAPGCVGALVLHGCGGVADSGSQAEKDGGANDAVADRAPRSCVPLPGCTSTTTCPADCNSCTCVDGAWACTAKACAAGRCCPPDPHPGCCMQYGGWSDTGSCGMTCDGMPEPGDPAWHQVADSHGCAVWSSQGSTGPLCGQAFDAGLGGPVDAAHDTGACVSARGGRCGG